MTTDEFEMGCPHSNPTSFIQIIFILIPLKKLNKIGRGNSHTRPTSPYLILCKISIFFKKNILNFFNYIKIIFYK